MRTEETPLVSVIIPTHDSARFIAEAVRAALMQTYRRREVIVIDDGSCDETGDILRGFAGQISYRYQENRGPAAARNVGIKMARGKYICFLDADDLWTPNKLELQVEFMAAHSEVGLLFADADEWEDEQILKPSILATVKCHAAIVSQVPIREAFRKLVTENFIPTSSVMIRKDCFLRTGLFDEDLRVVEDRDLWLRVAANCDIACLPMVLVTKRHHGANISTGTELTARSRIRVWEQARRRFPTLAPRAVYHRLLANTHQELGYLLLSRADGSGARRVGNGQLEQCDPLRGGHEISLSIPLVTVDRTDPLVIHFVAIGPISVASKELCHWKEQGARCWATWNGRLICTLPARLWRQK